MIKFAATLNEDDGTQKQMIGLGISEGNVLKLKAGLPIKVDLRDMGITEGPVRYIGLFYGGTDQELAEMVKPMIGPETKVNEQKKAHEG